MAEEPTPLEFKRAAEEGTRAGRAGTKERPPYKGKLKTEWERAYRFANDSATLDDCLAAADTMFAKADAMSKAELPIRDGINGEHEDNPTPQAFNKAAAEGAKAGRARTGENPPYAGKLKAEWLRAYRFASD